ncbi:glycosyltransferase family 2 protein [Arthrobacter sp. H14-L1]|uniref:glycosyltransferase family 2 protein n=1 Tax=Arthrobacter sp. H14-L1 TaxID=2996697 RepID=UPI00226ED2EE|nr:glycosyltransferase family 2 protein [Arthrobacter sp. H14-L1]MCY0903681.1 glycosyltransferase family 2 protein [Arthrobacter sp. H14-L1]
MTARGDEAAGLPSISVVIPCRNDAELLAKCLASLGRQTHPPLEIIVVDNNSDDESAEVARRHGVRLVTEMMPGIPAAAAAGYDAAVGEIIARCDADCLLPTDWLQRIGLEFLQNPDLGALTGPGSFYGLPRFQGFLLSRLYMSSYFLAVGAAMAHFPLFGSNLAIRRSCWTADSPTVHRSDPEMHDDICLSLHLGLNYRIRYIGGLRVGMSARALHGRSQVRRRFRRAFHTLRTHWVAEPPWQRWQRRVMPASTKSAAT